ncbi:MAG: TrkH family potassium uptake protein [Myxococcota bacterium]
MNLLLDLRILGGLIALVGLFQLLPVGTAALFGEPVLPYLGAAAITMACGAALALGLRPSDQQIRPRDGFFIVGCGWILSSLFGALPYLTTGALGPANAFFESASGFTTTGSTVMTHIEGTAHALLLWRAFTQWLGGMGIIVFSIAILPLLGIGGMQLFKAEIPGPIADKVRPRIAATARRLWYIYVGFTGAEVIALRVAGLSWYEALCHGFTTMSTGGFSTRDASIAAFHSPAVEWIIITFMLMGGINFVLHYRVLVGRGRDAIRDTEFRYFLATVLGAAVVIGLALLASGYAPEGLARASLFQTVSILTTTGYVTVDFETWPSLAQFLLLMLMIVGGMAGSTGGGVKSLRMLMGLRAIRANIDRLIHPHAVRPVKYGGKPVQEDVLEGIWAFFAAYLILAGIAAAVVSASGYDLMTAVSAACTSLSNVGPGLGDVGATDTFAHFPGHVKLVLAVSMIAGRLEIFTLILLLLPAFWRR